MRRIIFLSIILLIFGCLFTLADEAIQDINLTNEVKTNEPKSRENVLKFTEKTTTITSFETTVIGTLEPRDPVSSPFEINVYKKKGTSQDMLDYIQNIPFVYTPTYVGLDGGLITPWLRGDKADIMVNGLNISTAINSSYDLNLLDPFYFTGVSVYYGPSSSRYGSGHYMGVINFDTYGDEKQNFWRVIRSIGTLPSSFYTMTDLSVLTGLGKFYLGVGYIGSENIFSFNINTLYTNFSSLKPTNYTRQGAEYRKFSTVFRYIYRDDQLSVDTGFFYTMPTTHEPNQVDLTTPTSYEKAISKVNFVLPYLKLDYFVSPGWDIGLNVYYTEHFRDRTNENFLYSWGGSIFSKIYANKFVSEIFSKVDLLNDGLNDFNLSGSLSYKLDGFYSLSRNYSTFPSPFTNDSETNDSRNTLGVYLEGNYYFAKLLNLVVSVRGDVVDFSKTNYSFEYSPRVGVLISTFEFLKFRSSFWRSYRLPYFDDIYGGVVYGYGSVNTNLKTEYSHGFDLGIMSKFSFSVFRFDFSLGGFYVDSTNLIAFNPSTFTTENFQKVYNRGVETIARISYKEVLSSTISYVYTEPIDVNRTEVSNWQRVVFLPYRPLNTLFVDIVYDNGYYGVGAYLNYQWYRFRDFLANPLDDILSLSISMWARPLDYVEIGVEWKRTLIGDEFMPGYPFATEKVNGYVIYRIGW